MVLLFESYNKKLKNKMNFVKNVFAVNFSFPNFWFVTVHQKLYECKNQSPFLEVIVFYKEKK